MNNTEMMNEAETLQQLSDDEQRRKQSKLGVDLVLLELLDSDNQSEMSIVLCQPISSEYLPGSKDECWRTVHWCCGSLSGEV